MFNYPEKDKKKAINYFKKKYDLEFKNISLFSLALTHESFSYEKNDVSNSYEKLEFLGDAALNLVITDFLYHKYPKMDVGELAKIKSILISRKVLVEIAKKMKLGNYIYLGKVEESYGGRKKESIICDSFEALLGAVYIDMGISKVSSFLMNNFSDIFNKNTSIDNDHKSSLQEYLQKKYKKLPHYKVVNEEGPAHERIFTVQVIFNGKKLGIGKGKSKKTAQQQAARRSLAKISQLNN